MSADAGAFRYLTGHPGIVTPNDPLPTIEAAMRAYDVRWLVLESDRSCRRSSRSLRRARPPWLSPAVAVVPGPRASVATAGADALGRAARRRLRRLPF